MKRILALSCSLVGANLFCCASAQAEPLCAQQEVRGQNEVPQEASHFTQTHYFDIQNEFLQKLSNFALSPILIGFIYPTSLKSSEGQCKLLVSKNIEFPTGLSPPHSFH